MTRNLDWDSPYRRKDKARAKQKANKIKELKQAAEAAALEAHYVARDEMQILPSQVTAERLSLWDKAKDMSASELRATVRKGGGIGVMQLVDLVQNSYDEQIKAAASKALVDASVAISKIELPILQMQDQQTKTITPDDASILDAYLTTKPESKPNE